MRRTCSRYLKKTNRLASLDSFLRVCPLNRRRTNRKKARYAAIKFHEHKNVHTGVLCSLCDNLRFVLSNYVNLLSFWSSKKQKSKNCKKRSSCLLRITGRSNKFWSSWCKFCNSSSCKSRDNSFIQRCHSSEFPVSDPGFSFQHHHFYWTGVDTSTFVVQVCYLSHQFATGNFSIKRRPHKTQGTFQKTCEQSNTLL